MNNIRKGLLGLIFLSVSLQGMSGLRVRFVPLAQQVQRRFATVASHKILSPEKQREVLRTKLQPIVETIVEQEARRKWPFVIGGTMAGVAGVFFLKKNHQVTVKKVSLDTAQDVVLSEDVSDSAMLLENDELIVPKDSGEPVKKSHSLSKKIGITACGIATSLGLLYWYGAPSQEQVLFHEWSNGARALVNK